ncbi:MAG: hypothetical protein KGJ87_07880 [Planctomycetota bacterium]|nr:hypothetical protein [Planctomycetota bacterium]MDE1890408.1 hypothetical protein [Planctomycetota bacterium]MDE2217059.1 hypothetical protein [Planctomycetota bacterium]
MKRIVYFAGVVGIAFVLMTSYVAKTTFASSCCGDKECAEKSDNKCIVCGKAIDKDKAVKTECDGKTITLCCKSCEAAFKKDPAKFCADKCEKDKCEKGEKK